MPTDLSSMYNVYYGSAYIIKYIKFTNVYYGSADIIKYIIGLHLSGSGPTKFCALKVKYK